ncbi:hypothetical protein OCK74_06705 [Chitinophagaceae bacterium LB-8]|uniref:Glycosyl hydrolase family 95 catalytic domain-containing protein n=1 Tax=Paraflavisolibacter caeni TaxID=2982496 RepID=A0A9X2XUG2_9BACT|nr:hypothetical protein [Paraflavisolibacter caeni]MCU7548800.1 hypothetical protein [Paraflavisolibacter caeni]
MKALFFIASLVCVFIAEGKGQPNAWKNVSKYKNTWNKPPSRIPNRFSVDAPLMGNGDMMVCTGFDGKILRYYISKNDFWRLKSQGDGLSGPRLAGCVDIAVKGFDSSSFSAQQLLSNGTTTCFLKIDDRGVEVSSWVAATENILFIEIYAKKKAVEISLDLSAPQNNQAQISKRSGPVSWLTRSFEGDVDMSTGVAIAFKILGRNTNSTLLQKGKKVVIAVAIESKFKKDNPLKYVQGHLQTITPHYIDQLKKNHDDWWKDYWSKSSVTLSDTLLEKAWYQGLYTMGACSRDPRFPPGLFGWTTNDQPGWNGDYHLNYNFQAPFYCLASANRLKQAAPHDAPLLDFISRGEWYARKVTNTRGILYPVGIGPLGIEVTRNFPNDHYKNHGDIESGGLFFGQRSNAIYGLVNMAQYWRCTYDSIYGEKIYPYVFNVVAFWEDYLRLENNRLVIYGDAIHEGSGANKNPILTLGLLRNALQLIIDLSKALQKDELKRDKWENMLVQLSTFPIQQRNGKKVFRYTEEGVDWWDGNGLGIQHIYPGNVITLDSDPQLLEISKNTIDQMQRWHDANTSNSFFMAAIRVGYDPEKIIHELRNYSLHTYPNGFQYGNPHGIENSCTVTNAVNEMLCMSVGNVIRIMQGYPVKYDAQFSNIRTWGAFLVSAKRVSGHIGRVTIISEMGNPCTIMNPWDKRKVKIIRNGKKAELQEGERLTFNTYKNETIELEPLEPNNG